ncbi:hypothetical protein CHS0354_026435 [Potamilus streckersoni]|uniref:Mab-21-like HhH/H2TH-like domain-containing protein n=1 Tax=Potamilus streckersoni TaxID=2493646 RepID=A0AAE0VH60_9BIVA|nr:hypothetical protein CHS0354_026435 [Potamilus streckersoni]
MGAWYIGSESSGNNIADLLNNRSNDYHSDGTELQIYSAITYELDGTICVNMNISDYYERVSMRLSEVLDASGLKDDLRWRRINTWLQTEELEKIWHAIADPGVRLYYFGSQTEATTTPGLSSDIDKVVFIHHYVVLKDIQFWQPSLETETIFLMVADESTPPGYVKFQLVQRDEPMPVYNYQFGYVFLDSEGRSVLSNRCFPEVSGNLLGNLSVQFDQHGPAVTTLRTGMSLDLVYAIPSRCWPDQGFRWMSRSRKYNWPTRPMMDVIMKTVVFFVPVGLRISPEQHLEWRLSFSFAEKLLIMQFNSTQYKCYVMLKLIKNTFLNVNTVETVLTSYHCKTCMFYLIENTRASLWHPRNLMLCIDVCLKQLLTWIQCANCPNYFVPDENMFLCKLRGPAQKKIANILQDLLSQNGKYITTIRYENIGENVARAYPSLGMNLRCPDENIILQTIGHLENILHFFCLYCVSFHLSNVSVLKSRYGPRREIGNIVRLIFCSVLGNHLASQSLQQQMYNHENLIVANELLRWGSSSDVAA